MVEALEPHSEDMIARSCIRSEAGVARAVRGAPESAVKV